MEPTLLRSVMDFPLGSTQRPTALTERLIREQGWSPLYATRVVHEYRRFLCLSEAAGHPVSPPHDVDEAWHTHILFTRNYWIDFCQNILGHPLHHDPDVGLPGDKEKFADWYAHTVESYEQLFGEAPPEDIWPLPRTAVEADAPAPDTGVFGSSAALESQLALFKERFRRTEIILATALVLSLTGVAVAAIARVSSGSATGSTRTFQAGAGPSGWGVLAIISVVSAAIMLVALIIQRLAAYASSRQSCRSRRINGSGGCSAWIPGVTDGGATMGAWNNDGNSHGHHHGHGHGHHGGDAGGGHHGGGSDAGSSGHHGCSTGGHSCGASHGCGSSCGGGGH